LAKAKALRKYVEPLITKSEVDSTHSRRTVFSYSKDKDAITILFREISEKVANRPGGYTRIIKLANRVGDNSEMALSELDDCNEVYNKGEAKVANKATRRRGSTKHKVDATVAAEVRIFAASSGEQPDAPVTEEALLEEHVSATTHVTHEM